MKFVLMNAATRASGYTSASSRAHPLHIGAAVKSRRTGFFVFFDSASALSTSSVQGIASVVMAVVISASAVSVMQLIHQKRGRRLRPLCGELFPTILSDA